MSPPRKPGLSYGPLLWAGTGTCACRSQLSDKASAPSAHSPRAMRAGIMPAGGELG